MTSRKEKGIRLPTRDDGIALDPYRNPCETARWLPILLNRHVSRLRVPTKEQVRGSVQRWAWRNGAAATPDEIHVHLAPS